MNKATVAEEVGFVEVVDQAHEAFQLRLAGHSWREVAERTGYRTVSNATMAVRKYLARASAEVNANQRAEDLRLAVERHEALLAAWHEKAYVKLDEKAALVVLRTLSQLNKLQRLEEPDVTVNSEQTIVIAGTPEQYAAKLRAIAEGRVHELEGEIDNGLEG